MKQEEHIIYHLDSVFGTYLYESKRGFSIWKVSRWHLPASKKEEYMLIRPILDNRWGANYPKLEEIMEDTIQRKIINRF